MSAKHKTIARHEPHAESSNLANIILGGQDGLVNVLGLILGLAAATTESRLILAGGLAATFAESISMAAVAYTSKMADRDRYFAEEARERHEMETMPESETDEVREIYAAKGFKGKLLEDIVSHVTSDKELWLATMMREELDLTQISRQSIYRESFIVGLSTLVGSLLPLVSFFFLPVHQALGVSLLASVIALALVGLYKAKATVGRPGKSAIEMVLIGMGAAFAGYLIGRMFR